MKVISRQGLSAALAVAIGFAGLARSVTAAPMEPRPAFVIYLRNYAEVPSRTLAEAERTATEIFRKGGIEVRWREIVMSPHNSGVNGVPEELMTLADIQVNIFPDTTPNPGGTVDNVAGVAPGTGPDRTLADVFDGKVRALFWKISSAYFKGDIDWRVSEGHLLGYVIAHEVGHLLLNQQVHSSRGIMRGEWAFADFRDMMSGILQFTAPEVQLLRAEVLRRDAHEPIRAAEK
jgi:hypothetical protein